MHFSDSCAGSKPSGCRDLEHLEVGQSWLSLQLMGITFGGERVPFIMNKAAPKVEVGNVAKIEIIVFQHAVIIYFFLTPGLLEQEGKKLWTDLYLTFKTMCEMH